MAQLELWIQSNYSMIVMALLGAFVIGLLIFFVVIIRLNRLAKQYKTMMSGIEGKNLEEIMLDNAKTLEMVTLNLNRFGDKVKALEEMNKSALQKVALVRFDAFPDMGGDLSYALALIDNNNDGIVISCIYGRTDVRTYAKSVKNGKSDHKLSAEEEKAIKSAIIGNNVIL